MYELKIRDLVGVWHVADFGDDKPPMNYVVNDITELATRQNFSLSIHLPITNKNSKIFGYADIPNAFTKTPYEVFECRLYNNSYELAGRGAVIYLIEVEGKSTFRCQIISGFDNLPEALNKPMGDLDLGYITRENVPNLQFVSDTYKYPIATFWRDRDRRFVNRDGLPLPVVYVKKVMEQICEQNEFELIHNLGGKWDDYTTNICDLQPDEKSGEDFDFKAGAENDRFYYSIDGSDSGAPKIDVVIFADSQVANNGNGLFTLINSAGASYNTSGYNAFRYISKHNGKITINLNIEISLTTANPSGSEIIFSINKTSLDGERETMHSERKTGAVGNVLLFSYNEDVEVVIGDEITIGITMPQNVLGVGRQSTYQGTFSYNLTGTTIVENEVPIDFKLPLSKNLGFEMQSDYFRLMLQTFGLSLRVYKKKVYAFTMEKVYDNKKYALDWTDKLGIRNQSISFLFGDYAQQNNILMQQNTDDKVTDIGSFAVENRVLRRTKDLFVLPFESGVDYTVQPEGELSTLFVPIANIPIFMRDDDGEMTRNTGKPHLLKRGLQGNLTGNYYVANHVKAQELIDTFYPYLIKMLDMAKVFEVYMNLTDEDIDRYNQIHEVANCSCAFIPIYISTFGKYFYINKIQNYISGRLTKVSLVKL